METKKGALTQDELLALWQSAVDISYSKPIIEAGDGNGLEVYGQLFAQLERVSQAVDTTTQAMFLCPWSGQSAPEAQGEASATVTLTFERNGLVERPLILGRGLIFVQEETTDVGEYEGVTVLTGRRYVLTEDLVFHPGERGPFQVVALAERPGYGYNNPLPDTIRRISQPGERLGNEHASVAAYSRTTVGVLVTTPNAPDTFVPESVGQYVEFTAGANAGLASRIATFTGPDLGVSPAIGSSVRLELLFSVDASVYAGTFQPGETATSPGGTSLRVVGERVSAGIKLITFVVLAGNAPLVGAVITGLTSGATLTARTILHNDTTYVAESPPSPGVGGATWKMLGWHTDWALTVTHPLSPEGGLAGWLDEIGKERDLQRSPGEQDDDYRLRLKDIGDVVSPNAIIRTVNKILKGLPFCFREVGTDNLPGFFYDGDDSGPSAIPHSPKNDAYDAYGMVLQGALLAASFINQEPAVLETTDSLIRWASGIYSGNSGLNYFFSIAFGDKPPGGAVGLQLRGLQSGAILLISAVVPSTGADDKKQNVYLSFTEFRAFFEICVPKLGLGEYGYAYDVGAHNAYDATLDDNFFDGLPYKNATIYGALFNAIDPIRAGGVGFDLCQGDTSCAP